MADAVSVALATVIANYEAALLADSTAPQPTYSIDGKGVSQEEWRKGLRDAIKELQDTINARNPTITWSSPYCYPYGNFGS